MAKGGKVVLVENRRRGQDTYLVDEEWFDRLGTRARVDFGRPRNPCRSQARRAAAEPSADH